MTTIVLLMLVLTCGAYMAMGAPAMARSRESVQGGAGRATMPPWQRKALTLAVVALLMAHLAQTSNLTQAALEVGGQDETAWAMRAQAQDSTAADAPALREGE